jgi:hypothetical protein
LNNAANIQNYLNLTTPKIEQVFVRKITVCFFILSNQAEKVKKVKKKFEALFLYIIINNIHTNKR